MLDRIISIEQNGVDFVSSNDMSLMGFKINPYSISQETNLVIFEDNIIDILVPLEDIELVFIQQKYPENK